MKNFAIALIATGMMVPACAGRKAAQQEVVNPLPAFAGWEPQRAPLLEDEETTQRMTDRENLQRPMASIAIVAVPGDQEAPQFQPVYFGFGSARLDPADAAQLAESAEWLRDNPEQQVRIEGHTDATGPSQYNLELGERRAEALRDYLIQLGVDEGRLQIVSRGEAAPESGQNARNRRAEVVLVPDTRM